MIGPGKYVVAIFLVAQPTSRLYAWRSSSVAAARRAASTAVRAASASRSRTSTAAAVPKRRCCAKTRCRRAKTRSAGGALV